MPTIQRTSFGYLRIFLAFSCFTHNRGVTSENRTTAAGADHDATDGQLFLKRIVNGEKISENPGYLMFTAPYRLCEGGCKDINNFVMAFPLFIGKKGKSDYQSMYPRDYYTAKNKDAPFKPLQTRLPYTTCAILKSSTTASPDPTVPSSDPTTPSPDTTTDTVNQLTSSTTVVWDTPGTLKCPKLAKCKPKNKLRVKANSLFPSFNTRTSRLLRSTLRPLYLRSHRPDTEYYWNNYEIRPYRTIQVHSFESYMK